MTAIRSNSDSNHPLWQALGVVRSQWWLLAIPSLVLALAAGVYGLLSSKQYSATQSLIIRDDLASEQVKLGRFDSEESLKSAQEMVLEIARGPEILASVLQEVGPPSSIFSFGGGDYPGGAKIESVQGKINIGAPNGGEFGKTDVFVLSSQESTRDRSSKFMELLLNGVEQRLREVRAERLSGMQRELEQKVAVANEAFAASSKELGELEESLGQDLSAIRSLSVEFPNEGSLAVQVQQLENEIRTSQDNLERAQQQLAILQRSKLDRQNVSTTRELFTMQPTLEIMFRDLAAATKLRSADLGRYQEFHPKIQGHDATISDLKEKIAEQIELAILGVESQIETLEALYQRRLEKKNELVKRLQRLAKLRVRYSQIKFETQKKQEIYGQAYERLVDIQSLKESSESVDIVTRVGSVQVSMYPDGPSTKMLVIAGGAGGFMIGLGILILIAPSGRDPGSNVEQNFRTRQNEQSSELTPQELAAAKAAEDRLASLVSRSKPPRDVSTDRQSDNLSATTSPREVVDRLSAAVGNDISSEGDNPQDVDPPGPPVSDSERETSPARDHAFAESAKTGFESSDSSSPKATLDEESSKETQNKKSRARSGGLAQVLRELKSSSRAEESSDNVLDQLRESLAEVESLEVRRVDPEEMADSNESATSNVSSESNASDIVDSELVESQTSVDQQAPPSPAIAEEDPASINPVRREESGTMLLDPQLIEDTSSDVLEDESEKDPEPVPIVPSRRPDVRPIDLIRGKKNTDPESEPEVPRRVTATEAAESLVQKLRAEIVEKPGTLKLDSGSIGSDNSIPTANEPEPSKPELAQPPRTIEATLDLDEINSEASRASFPVPIPEQIRLLGDSAESVDIDKPSPEKDPDQR